jgi:hypothetical protein
MTIPEGISTYLARNDIKRNPRLATYAGAKRYADKNPQRRKVEVRDIDGDAIPDVLLYYDKDGNGVFGDNERTHVNGYYPTKTDWGYKSRYWADREQFPEEFKNNKIGMGQYVEAMHKGFRRDARGRVHFENDATRDAFEANIKKHGGIIKRPHNLSSMQLWKKHIFDPVYYAYTAKGIKDPDPHTGKQKKLATEADFRYIVVSGKCYKDLISGPALAAATGLNAPPEGNEEALREYNRIKNSKAYKDQLAGIIEAQLRNFVASWNEVYNYLAYVQRGDRQLLDDYGPITLTAQEIQNAYDARHSEEDTLTTGRRRAYGNLTRANNLAHDNNFDATWQWAPPAVERHGYWQDTYNPNEARQFVTRYNAFAEGDNHLLHTYYGLVDQLNELQDRQEDHVNNGDPGAAAKLEPQVQQVKKDLDDLLDIGVVPPGTTPSSESYRPPPATVPVPTWNQLDPLAGTGPIYRLLWKGEKMLSSDRLPVIAGVSKWIPSGGKLSKEIVTSVWKKTSMGTNLDWDNMIAQWIKDDQTDPIFLFARYTIGKPYALAKEVAGPRGGKVMELVNDQVKAFIIAVHDINDYLGRSSRMVVPVI